MEILKPDLELAPKSPQGGPRPLPRLSFSQKGLWKSGLLLDPHPAVHPSLALFKPLLTQAGPPTCLPPPTSSSPRGFSAKPSGSQFPTPSQRPASSGPRLSLVPPPLGSLSSGPACLGDRPASWCWLSKPLPCPWVWLAFFSSGLSPLR